MDRVYVMELVRAAWEMTCQGPGGQTLTGYLVRPEAPGRYPGVVVIQEWWGLDEHIKDIADRFAREGFIALAPDLYHGKGVSEPDEARKAVMQLDMPAAVREIQSTVAALLDQPTIAGHKVGLIGFSMGGGLVLQTVLVEEKIGAATSFYGAALPHEQAKQVKASVLAIYGGEDHSIPLEAVEEMDIFLDDAGVDHEVLIYPGAGHSFFNDTRDSYDPKAAADAWPRVLAWFRRYLGQ